MTILAHSDSHIGTYSVCSEVTYVTSIHISKAKTSPRAMPHFKEAKEVQSYPVPRRERVRSIW